MSVILDILGIVIALVAVGLAYIKWSHGYFKRRGWHHLEPNFPLGNSENPLNRTKCVGQFVKDIYDHFRSKKLPYGGFYTIARPTMVPVDPDVIKSIISKNFQKFTDRGLYANEETNNLNGHLFFLGGNRWRKLRVKLTPTFTSGKMKMMFDTLVACGKPMLESLEDNIEQGKSLDIKEVLGCFTTDVIGSCAFGLECNSFKEKDAEFRKYGKLIFYANAWIIIKFLFGTSFPELARKLGVDPSNKEVKVFFNKVVKDTVEYRENNNYRRNDFMQLLIDLKNSENGNGLTLEELAAQAFVFFLAGFETSSTAMTYALYELSLHQKIQDKAREEVRNVLKKYDGNLTYEAMHEMKYLGQIVDETLRKYPALPVLHRKCTEDCFIEEAGITVEKGQIFLIPVLGLHYDPEYFPDPEKFDPERFNAENKPNIKPYTYLPFGEGPRNCIGARFGLMQSKVGLALLLNQYQFTLSEKTVLPIKYNTLSLILSTEGGMWLDAKKV